jgi:hypothetical protein
MVLSVMLSVTIRILVSMLSVKYRQVVGKQTAILRLAAGRLQQLAIPVVIVTIVLYLAIAVGGIALSLNYNQDADDFMSPVGSLYEQRYHKYKDIFPENSTSNYQGHWIMKGLGMYVSVVMYPEGTDGLTALQMVDNKRQADGKLEPMKPEQTVGFDTITRFQNLVERHVMNVDWPAADRSNASFTDLCAGNFRQPDFLTGDQCYRMTLEWFFNQGCRQDLCQEMLRGPNKRNPATDFIIDFPSAKTIAFRNSSASGLVVVPVAEIFGAETSKDENEGLKEVACEREYAGKSNNKFNATCYDFGDNGKNIQAVRYAWHLKYDTPEDKERSQQWMNEIVANCQNFEDQANVEAKKLFPNTTWRFMCYKSTSISDGAKEAIAGDIKLVATIILVSLILPTVVLVKPCMKDNFSMLMLIMVGLFFLTLLATIGLGSLFGLDIVYSFIIAILFILWSFTRVSLHMVESLKAYITRSRDSKSLDGSSPPDAFQWLFSYWSPLILTNGLVIGITSLLCCTAMYKLVWCTAGFISVFFFLTIITVFALFFPITSLVLKSRSEGGSPCCMGQESEHDATLDSGLLARVKSCYTAFIFSKWLFKLIIVAVFSIVFLASLAYSINVFATDDSDPAYYGYDRRDIVLPEDNVHRMLDVLLKYFPNNGPLVQLIFNNKAHYENKVGDDGSDACEGSGAACSFHIDMLVNGIFEPLWKASPLSWSNWTISFYTSFVRATSDNGEKDFKTIGDLKNKFSLTSFGAAPLYPLYPDMARLHLDDDSSAKQSADPYTRMFIRQRYNTHTANEVAFMRALEKAQQNLVSSDFPNISTYFPADSLEIYSNLFPYYEQSRDILSRTFILPATIIGAIICLLFFSVCTMPHPLAQLAIFINCIMLFFEAFAIQVLFGTTVNNFSMAFYFLIYVFAIDYTLYATHGYLKFIVEQEPAVPAPSPLPALTIIVIALFAFIVLLVTPIYSQVGVAVRNCVFVFGIVGPLHELLFMPSLLGVLICPQSCDNAPNIYQDNGNKNGSSTIVELKATNVDTAA